MADAFNRSELTQGALAHGPGLDANEADLRQIERLLESQDVLSASDRAAALLQSGVTDVRVVCARLQGAFWREGPTSLAAIFDCVRFILGDALAFIRPEERKLKMVDGSLRGVLRAVTYHWAAEAESPGPASRAWPTMDRAGASSALEALASLRASASSLDGLSFPKLLSPLDASLNAELSRVLLSPPPPPPPPEPAPKALPEVDSPRTAHEDPAALTVIPIGHEMAVFLQKLRAFETLIARGESLRAAIVAEDIRYVLDHFDPRVYLPGLLARHFVLLSENLSEIEPLTEETDSPHTPQWRVLEQHYKVDLDGFVGRGRA